MLWETVLLRFVALFDPIPLPIIILLNWPLFISTVGVLTPEVYTSLSFFQPPYISKSGNPSLWVYLSMVIFAPNLTLFPCKYKSTVPVPVVLVEP